MGSFLIATTSSIDVLFNGLRQVNPGEVGDVEIRLPHQLLDVGLPQDGAADRRTVAALVPGVVLDVVDGFGVGGRDAGLGLDGGRARHPILERAGKGRLVLRIGAGSGDLPRLLDVPL